MMRTVTNRRGQFVEIARADLREIIAGSIHEVRRVESACYVRSLRAVICRVRGVVFTREALRADRLREAAKPAAQRAMERRPHGPEIIDEVHAGYAQTNQRKCHIYLQRTYPGRSLRWYNRYCDSHDR